VNIALGFTYRLHAEGTTGAVWQYDWRHQLEQGNFFILLLTGVCGVNKL